MKSNFGFAKWVCVCARARALLPIGACGTCRLLCQTAKKKRRRKLSFARNEINEIPKWKPMGKKEQTKSELKDVWK